MTTYITKLSRGDASDVDINSDDVDITAQPTYTVDDLFKRSYGPTIYPQDVIAKGPWVDVRAFGASGSAQQTTGSMTAGEFELTLTDARDFVDGMGIRVTGAGSGGANLTATISSGGGTTTLTLATAASTTVTSVAVAHDDQSAFDAAVAYAAENDLKVLFIPRSAFTHASALVLTAGLSVVGYEEFSYTSVTAQQALQFTLPDNSTWAFHFRVLGKRVDAVDRGSWIQAGTAYRYDAGIATLMYDTYNELMADFDATYLRCYPSVSFNDLRLTLQGVTTNSTWLVHYLLDGV
jgi:hypothetical protein